MKYLTSWPCRTHSTFTSFINSFHPCPPSYIKEKVTTTQCLTFGRCGHRGGCTKQEDHQSQHHASSPCSQMIQTPHRRVSGWGGTKGPKKKGKASPILSGFVWGEGRLQTPRSSTKYEITHKSLTWAETDLTGNFCYSFYSEAVSESARGRVID